MLDISGTYASTLGQNNPTRYRGYYYDSGTGLYYLNSRYYDSAVGRFMNADSFDTLIATPKQLTDKNLFAYCDNNPIVRIDEGGEFWNWVIGASVGAIVGVAGQFVSDLVTSALNQKLTFSNWQTYAGAFVGGAAGGAMAKDGGKVIDNLTKNFASSLMENTTRKVAGKIAYKSATGVAKNIAKNIGANAAITAAIAVGQWFFARRVEVTLNW